MPEDFSSAIAFLFLGYVLIVAELLVPGGVLGVLGTLAVIYGCYEAFTLGPLWGLGSVVASLVVFGVVAKIFLRAKSGMVLDHDLPGGPADWRSNSPDLEEWVGREGVAASDLRPSGIGTFGDERLDIVSDSEFIPVGAAVRVVEVEGRRIMVEPAAGWGGDGAADASTLDEAHTDRDSATTDTTVAPAEPSASGGGGDD